MKSGLSLQINTSFEKKPALGVCYFKKDQKLPKIKKISKWKIVPTRYRPLVETTLEPRFHRRQFVQISQNERRGPFHLTFSCSQSVTRIFEHTPLWLAETKVKAIGTTWSIRPYIKSTITVNEMFEFWLILWIHVPSVGKWTILQSWN